MVNAHYPFTGKIFERNGLKLHYLDEGSGPPVVMLHGNPTWSIYYRNLVQALSGTHRCIVPDHIGCGLSDKPDDARYTYRLQQRVDDIEALLEHVGIRENITLVVHDWGGMIGMAFATRHPERIARIVAMNTSAFSLPKTKSFPWGLWLCRNTRLGAFLVRRFNAFSAIASHVCCKRSPMPKDLRHAYRAPYNTWENRIATLRFVQDIPLKPTDPSYPIVHDVESNVGQFRQTPMLLCWGMKDFVFDKHFLKLWEDAFPQAEVHRFDDCGHYILEDAKEEVIPIIQEFIRKNGASS